jgi:putative salt-induced outer membrane protein
LPGQSGVPFVSLKGQDVTRRSRALIPSAIILSGAVAAPTSAAPIPQQIRAMLDTAIASKDANTIAAVTSVAKKTAPDSAAEIDAIFDDYQQHQKAVQAEKLEAERERLASASLLSLWKGQFEVGGSRTTGNTDTLGLYGAIKGERKGLHWTHSLTARIDYQRTDGQPTTERILAAYQPRYLLSPGFYTYGLTQYEHDRSLGYRDRYTAGAGLGVTLVDKPDLKIDVDVGPAFRYTEFYEEPRESRIAGRGSLAIRWKPVERITLTQEASVYGQRGGTTAASTTAIDTMLFGPVKGRLSYAVQYESDQPDGQKPLDTVSRASLVYNF